MKKYESYIHDPKNKEKRKYMFHSEERENWTNDMYKQFLIGLEKFLHITINNRKIA